MITSVLSQNNHDQTTQKIRKLHCASGCRSGFTRLECSARSLPVGRCMKYSLFRIPTTGTLVPVPATSFQVPLSFYQTWDCTLVPGNCNVVLHSREKRPGTYSTWQHSSVATGRWIPCPFLGQRVIKAEAKNDSTILYSNISVANNILHVWIHNRFCFIQVLWTSTVNLPLCRKTEKKKYPQNTR